MRNDGPTPSSKKRFPRFVLVFGVVALLLNLLVPSTAVAEDPDPRSVQGSARFVRVSSSPNSQEELVVFHCSALALPDAVATLVSSCEFLRDSEMIAAGPPRALPGPAVDTEGHATIDPTLGGVLEVCWEVGAVFSDATSMTEEGCGIIPS